MHQNPLVSVVMATYNGQHFLLEQIESILNQTYSPIEFIICDDCSTDKTFDILLEYAEKYKHIKLFRNEENIGFRRNFEKAILLSTGSMVAPCDQDDIWDLQKIEILVKEIGSNAIVYSDSELIDDNGKKLGKKYSDIKNLQTFDDCLMYAIGNCASGHAMLIKREVINQSVPFSPTMSHDLWLGFVASMYAPVAFYNKPLVFYRQHTHNVFGLPGNIKRAKKAKPSKVQQLNVIRDRMRIQYEKCLPNIPQKQVYKDLYTSYQSFSMSNNWLRMTTFFKNRHKILAYKKKPNWRKWLFSWKMFAKID
jgi:glycosyltransferase involved in cell wall biosynthesis